MPGDSLYQDLQFKDTNLYSVLEASAAANQITPKQPQISKDVGEQEKKLRKWKIVTTVMTLISIIVIVLAIVIYVTTCKKRDINSTQLRALTGNVCANGEMPCSYCAQNWLYFSGNCYLFSSDSMNWNDSRASCLRKQADLAVIKSDAEETFVEDTAHGSHWIGLSKGSAGQWIFVDGTTLTGKGFFKNPGEPSNSGGNENCIEVVPSNYGNSTGWNDLYCSALRRHICKQPALKFSA